MTIEQLRKILEEMNIDFEPRPSQIYIFYETPDGLVNNLSISVRRAKRRDGRRMNQHELMGLMEGYPDARDGKVIAVEHPDKGLTRWLDTNDVCRQLHTCPHTLRNWVRRGLLHPSRVGRANYYSADEIDRLLRSNIIQENGRIDKMGNPENRSQQA